MSDPPKRNTPGAGLGFLFPEEPVTSKMATAPVVPDSGAGRVNCPSCRGSTFESIEELDAPALGTYRVVQCQMCEGRGRVTPAEAAAIAEKMTKT